MKVAKLLDAKATTLISDPLNQTILKNLVDSEYSVSELAAKLELPTLKLWRRMQQLLKASLVELSSSKKVGNLEKKLYRATATWYVPHQYFEFKPKDQNLQAAYSIYSDIQKSMMSVLSEFNEVPKGADPIDFSLFANMQAFVQVCGKSATQAKIEKLKQKLTLFQNCST